MDTNSIWNCYPEIALFLHISQCAFAGLIQSSSQSFQGCQPKTDVDKSYPWPSTIATSGCVFSTNKIYQIFKSRVPRNIMKHQLDHLTECSAFFPNKPWSIQVWCLGNATCVVVNGTCTGTAGGAGVATCKWTNHDFTWNHDFFDQISWRLLFTN